MVQTNVFKLSTYTVADVFRKYCTLLIAKLHVFNYICISYNRISWSYDLRGGKNGKENLFHSPSV